MLDRRNSSLFIVCQNPSICGHVGAWCVFSTVGYGYVPPGLTRSTLSLYSHILVGFSKQPVAADHGLVEHTARVDRDVSARDGCCQQYTYSGVSDSATAVECRTA